MKQHIVLRAALTGLTLALTPMAAMAHQHDIARNPGFVQLGTPMMARCQSQAVMGIGQSASAARQMWRQQVIAAHGQAFAVWFSAAAKSENIRIVGGAPIYEASAIPCRRG